MGTVIHTPHDRLVKASLKDKRMAIDFLKSHLPADLQQRINFKTLALTDKEFILPHLKQLQSDIIYQCKIDGHLGYIFFLIEHQAKPDPLMAFRKVQYNVALMDDHLKQGHSKLPIIISLCLYNGQQSPYPYSTDVYDCFKDPCLAQSVVFKPFQLIDLTVLSDEQLKAHGLAALMELLLKHNRDKRLVRFLKGLQSEGTLSRFFTALDDSHYLISVLQFILNTGEDKSHQVDDILTVFTQASNKDKEAIMTFAQQLEQRGEKRGIQQGMQQGMQQGENKGKLAIARNLLAIGLSADKISQATGLSWDEIKRLSNESC